MDVGIREWPAGLALQVVEREDDMGLSQRVARLRSIVGARSELKLGEGALFFESGGRGPWNIEFPIATVAELWRAALEYGAYDWVYRDLVKPEPLPNVITFETPDAAADEAWAYVEGAASRQVRKDLDLTYKVLVRKKGRKARRISGDELVSGLLEWRPSAKSFLPVNLYLRAPFDAMTRDALGLIKWWARTNAIETFEEFAHWLSGVFQGGLIDAAEQAMTGAVKDAVLAALDSASAYARQRYKVKIDLADAYRGSVATDVPPKNLDYFFAATREMKHTAPSAISKAMELADNVRLRAPIRDMEDLKLAIWG